MESMEDNQGFIDELKGEYGVQQPMWETAKEIMGHDVLWWLVPTRPLLKVNFLERSFPKRDIKVMYRNGKHEKNNVYSDADGLVYA